MILAPISIGSLSIVHPVFCAPMAGITDLPFRAIAKKYGAGVVITEMVSARACRHHNAKSLDLMKISADEHPVGIQLCGSAAEDVAYAARIAEAQGADFVDINCGCPAPKILKSGGGYGLMQSGDSLKEYFRTIVESVSIPVTIKLRMGDERSTERYREISGDAYEAGIKAITLHCRLKEHRHKGNPHYEAVAALVRLVPIPIIANGGIDTPEKALRVVQETKCAGII